MIKRRIIIVGVVFLINCWGFFSVHGQSAEVLGKQDLLFKANLMSPQAFGFNKYGAHQMNLSGGQIMVEVPIYTYSDRNFTIPISLTYNTPGFMPNQRESVVGLGWVLNAGGAITRVVDGVPDDSYNPQNITGYYQLNGLLYGIKNNLAVKTATKADILNLSAGSVTTNLFWNIGTCEVEPDLFSFNVPGLSGKFYIENNGEIRTIGNKPFKVDLSGVGIQYLQESPSGVLVSSSINIITDDGYKYEFGGTVANLEVVYTLNDDNEVLNPTINAWHLRKITAPNGQVLDYKYKAFTTGIHSDNDPNDDYHYLLNVNTVTFANADEYAYAGGAYGMGGSSSAKTIKTATKTVFLDEILVEGRISIKFYYEENTYKFYKDASYANNKFNQKNLHISKIEVRDETLNVIREFEFIQDYLGGTECRMFLTSFEESGAAPHAFTYYNTTSLPSPLTGAVDHWGFWNSGSFSFGSTIPTSDFHTNGDVDITGTERNPDIAKCKIAMLQKITYPTSGYSQFDYEAHDYNWRLDRKSADNFLPKLYQVTGYVGGARISQIKEHDGDKFTNVRNFRYTNDFPAATSSSGVLLKWPRYLFYWENNVPGTGVSKHLKLKSTSFNSSFSGNEHFIQYSEVTEETNGNGFINYLFTDYISNPDENDYQTIKLHPTLFDGISNKHLHNSYVGIYFNDKSFERGIQKRVRYCKYDENENVVLVRETKTNSFTSLSDFSNSYIAGAHMTGGIVQSFKKYYYPFLPKQVEETTYSQSGGTSSSVIHDYHYNSSGYLVRHTATGSNGVPVSSVALYPADFPAGTTFLDDMKTNNLLKFPIERVKYIETGGAKYILSGQIVKYRESGKGQIDKVMELEIPGEIPLANFKFSNRSTGILPPTGSSTGFSPDSKYQANVIIDSYDGAGNTNEQHKANNISQSFIWDYHSAYVVAEVKNAPLSLVAYSSFESDGKGNWTYTGTPVSDPTSPTGKKIYTIVNSANNITKNGLSTTTTYIVSYWKKSGSVSVNGVTPTTGKSINGWTYYEHKVVNPSGGLITVSGTNGVIDELRLYPATAQMTTYTYEPLIGMTSQCDAGNRITYYEYDGFGKLVQIRDQDKNIIKKICYNYAGQPENCTLYGNIAKSGTFTKACSAGYTGSSVTYTVPADTYTATTPTAADQLAQDDVNANGQAYANANGTCTQSCSFSAYTGYNIVSSGVTSSGGTVSFYIVFNSLSGTTYWPTINQVATMNGTCKPVSTKVFTMSESGRTWQVIITNTGAFSLQLLGGTPPTGTTPIALTGGSFTP